MNGRQAQGPANREQTALSEVLQAIRRVRHGCVQVIVQDGKAIQIDTTENKRLDPQDLNRASELGPETGAASRRRAASLSSQAALVVAPAWRGSLIID